MIVVFCSKVDIVIVCVEVMVEVECCVIFIEFDFVCISVEVEVLIVWYVVGEKMVLFGMLVLVKDLYDEVGQVMVVGLWFLFDQLFVSCDVVGVVWLCVVGVLMFGCMLMLEFVYFGVGLNLYYGMLFSVLVVGIIFGGLLLGGVVMVGLGFMDVVFGIDIGGLLCIFVVVNGLWGIKLMQGLIDDSGVYVFVFSFDMFGLMVVDFDLLCQMVEVMVVIVLMDVIMGFYMLVVLVGVFINGLLFEVEVLFVGDQVWLCVVGYELQLLDLMFLGEVIGLNCIIVVVQVYWIYVLYLIVLEMVGDLCVLLCIWFVEMLLFVQVQDVFVVWVQIVVCFDVVMVFFDVVIVLMFMCMFLIIVEVEVDFDVLNVVMLCNILLVNLVDGCVLVMFMVGVGGWLMIMLVGWCGMDVWLFVVVWVYG